ncbi:SusC/RagA family TonB-linked outer membrane protein [Nonlabens xiamenensis]|uniref:SusC/RagA family TonB-linked outer membrane protein n=1 Tax=Nonlabens xiamenensis TaxID=2341043 RepID=UPI000F60D52C|nr:TonB-dependent receptor [Nonlabens xiamenensis]
MILRIRQFPSEIIRQLALIAFLFYCSGLEAQTISGTVTNVEGEPLLGVVVAQKETKNAVTTGLNGGYQIILQEGQSDVLVFSYLGYATTEKQVAGETTINVKMIEETEKLEEIVLIGYGVEKRKDVTGAISSIDAKDLEDQVYNNLTETLQGQAAGVFVNSDSGEPGAGISVNIRGINSISGSVQPLYVLNGIPLGEDIQAENDQFLTGTNPLAGLNPDDIESIEILKDASATAIYGVRAGNGVVLITTKEARAGKTRLAVNLRSSYTSIGMPYELLNGPQYAQLRNDLVVLRNPQTSFQDLLDNNQIPFDGRSEERPLPENAPIGTDFMDAIFRTGQNENVNVSISGGNDSHSQLLSVNYNNVEGNIINSNFRRMNLRYNSKMKVGKKFSLNSNVQLNFTRNQRVQTSARTGLTGVVFSAMRINPLIPLFDPETGDLNEFGPDDQLITNPVIEATQSNNFQRDRRLILSSSAEYDFTPELKWTTRLGFNAGYNNNEVFNNKQTVVGRNFNGRLFLAEAETDRFTAESFLNFNKSFKKHQVSATVGGSYTNINAFRRREVYSDFTFDDLGVDAIRLANSAQDFNSIKTNNFIQSALYRFNYTFDDKYTLTTTGRYDGDSKFSQGDPWGFFPSAAIAWDAHKERFIRNIRAISLLKFRASYGVVGSSNGVAPYSTLDTYNIGIIGLGGSLDDLYTGTFPARIANQELTWETSTTLNIGLTANFLKNRLRTSIDVYERETEDLLNQLPIPTQTGFNSIPINAGTLNNKGVEIEIAYDIFNNENFSWTSKLNWTKSSTELVDYGLNEFVDGPGLGANFFQINGTRTFPGDELGLFYGYRVIGLIQPDDLVDYQNGNFNIRTVMVDDGNGGMIEEPIFATTARNNAGNGNAAANTPGQWIFEDVNDDGIINIEDRQAIGNPNPDFFFGWNNQFRIGDFNVNMFVQGSVGNDILNLNKAFVGSGWSGGNSTQDYFNNRWTLDNQHNDINYPSNIGPTGVNIPNSVYIEDGTYVRLKNLSVRYNLTKIKYFERAAITLTGTNLITLTNYTGPDPEVSTNGNGALNRGIDYSAYPRPQVYSLGLQLNF